MKNIEYVFKNNLTQEEKDRCNELFGAQDAVSVQQNLEWDSITERKRKPSYFLMSQNKQLLAYSIIHFPEGKVAHIPFGPICTSREAAVESVRIIIEYFRKAGFFYMTIQLPGPTSETSDFTEFRINRDHKVKYFFDKRNWTTSVINLEPDSEQIIKRFASNHRGSIKKAKKLGVTARVIDSFAEIEAFNEIYVRMYKARGYDIDLNENLEAYKKMLRFFKERNNGFFFGAFSDGDLVGGFITLIQGETALYYHAATDPEKRKIPMQHIAIATALDELKKRGLRRFDLGGYNHLVGEDDQVHWINKFKDGFTKDYIFYPRLMYIEFVPMSIKLLEAFQRFKGIVKKIIRR